MSFYFRALAGPARRRKRPAARRGGRRPQRRRPRKVEPIQMQVYRQAFRLIRRFQGLALRRAAVDVSKQLQSELRADAPRRTGMLRRSIRTRAGKTELGAQLRNLARADPIAAIVGALLAPLANARVPIRTRMIWYGPITNDVGRTEGWIDDVNARVLTGANLKSRFVVHFRAIVRQAIQELRNEPRNA